MAQSDSSEALRPGIVRLPLRTPTLPPAQATNTLLVGRERLLVIEPATPHRAEQAVLDEHIDRRRRQGSQMLAILLTHHHTDHVGYAEALARRLKVPVAAHAETAERVPFSVQWRLTDGEVIEVDEDHTVEAVHTPGHAPGHLVFVERNSAMAYAGDMVAGEGTVLIDPDDAGDMAAYLQSLRRLQTLGLQALVPSHGPVLTDVPGILEHYIEHRLARERKIEAVIASGTSGLAAVLERSYDDKPPEVRPLARRALLAHLHKLQAEGRIVREGDAVRKAPIP